MKKLIIFSGAAVIGIIMAAAVVLHCGNGADDLFESNIRALSDENPEDVKVPCKSAVQIKCVFGMIDADGVKRTGILNDMVRVWGSGN